MAEQEKLSLLFRQGKLSKLASTPAIEGALSITTDEGAIYLDVKEGENVIHKRLSDILWVDNIAALVTKTEEGTEIVQNHNAFFPYNENALYYAKAENVLLRWDSKESKWHQLSINMTELESALSDIGNALSTKVSTVWGANNAQKVLITNSNGDVDLTSKVTSIEIEHLAGITDNVQEQLKAKASKNYTSKNVVLITDPTSGDISTSKITGDELAALKGYTGEALQERFSILNNNIDTTINQRLLGIEKNLEDNYLTSDATQRAINTAIQASDALVFKGVIDDFTQLPTSGIQAGWVYKVRATFIQGEKSYAAGDLLIASQDDDDISDYPQIEVSDLTSKGWYHIASGYEAQYASTLDFDADSKNVILTNGIGIANGSLAFKSETLDIAYNLDHKTESANLEVTMDLYWGSF